MAEVQSQFSGVAGQVLRHALHRSAWVSGMALAGTLLLAARGLDSIGRSSIIPVVAIPLLMLGLAYHAVRAATANRLGLDATVGRTVLVAVRASLASAVWFAPWMLWGTSLGPSPARFESMGAPSPASAGLFLFGCLFATPVILIAALHWGRQFNARGVDLMTVYTIQTGAATLSVAVVLPPVIGAIELHATIGLVTVVLAASAVLGYWISLTGRLCGSIYAKPVKEPLATEPRRFDEGMAFAGPAVDTGFNRDLAERRPAAEAPQEQVVTPPKKAVESEVPEAAKITRYVAPSKPVPFNAPRPNKNGRKTPLLDAEARAEKAMKRFRLDPSHTLSKLAELNQNFAPSAHVLQALAICLHRTGHSEQAFAAARRGFPLCFEQGHIALAAAMFYEFRGQPQKFDLKQDQILAIAKELHRSDELAAAAKAYSLVILANPKEFLAVKGLLDVADGILNEKKKPVAALKVYMFLLEHSKDPGVVEVARDGINLCGDAEEACAESESPA